jgi:hypothetical protein
VKTTDDASSDASSANVKVIVGIAIVLVVAGAAIFIEPRPPRSDSTYPKEPDTSAIDAQLREMRQANIKKWEAEAAAPPLRHKFEASLKGECTQGVLRAVGKPDSTSQVGNVEYWYYSGRSRDGTTGKTDTSAQVVMEGGCVVRVNFH